MSGGAGQFAAGSEPAGHDPVPAPSATVLLPKPIAAVFYDPATKNNPFNADGSLQEIHPVDQAVALSLCIPLGSIKSAPDTGHGIFRIRSTADKALQKKVENEVLLAVSALITAGDIEILLVEVSAPPSAKGRLETFVTYQNLRTRAIQIAQG